MTWTVRQVLQWTAAHLSEYGSDTGRLDAELLLGEALGLERIQLYMDPDRPLSGPERATYRELVRARVGGTPVAHLTGEREFWSLPIGVTPDVLIPRPDTETLVERALNRLPRDQSIRVLDLGTGTGCIAAALARERPRVVVDAVEIDPAAASVARSNLERLGLTGRVEVLEGDWLVPVADRRYGLIVANPPYVAESDPHLDHADVAAEPRGALAAGPDGLHGHRQILAGAPEHLDPGGWLLVEIGWDQGAAVRSLAEEAGLTGVAVHPDLGDRDRVVEGRHPESGS